ncbi:MAG: type II toxin-antitoxin system antitoxin SocA domain-containing protein [Patescibacteria group bacterium]
MITFAEKIKSLRLGLKLSQNEVADRIGLSRPSYIAVESGEKDLTLNQLRQLAAIFGIPLEELIFDTISVSSNDYNLEKYKQIILNSLEYGGDGKDGKITKTKLAKLAYLADFAWFYKNLVPMSGLAYRRIQQGPVPDQYFRIIDELFDSGTITVENKGAAFMIQLNEKASSDRLSKEELELIKAIGKKWKDKNTAEVVKFTHAQLPWKICRAGELIPYELITQEEPANVF